MPRKISIRPKPISNTRTHDRIGRVPHGKRYYQCINCGAPVDAMLAGDGFNNWCPSCHMSGDVIFETGHLPDPPLYGQWLLAQQAKERGPDPASSKPAPAPVSQPQPLNGNLTMKTPKSHTGTYSCLNCYIEFDLVSESSLKCDQCDGLLSVGTLEEIAGEELDEDDGQ